MRQRLTNYDRNRELSTARGFGFAMPRAGRRHLAVRAGDNLWPNHVDQTKIGRQIIIAVPRATRAYVKGEDEDPWYPLSCVASKSAFLGHREVAVVDSAAPLRQPYRFIRPRLAGTTLCSE